MWIIEKSAGDATSFTVRYIVGVEGLTYRDARKLAAAVSHAMRLAGGQPSEHDDAQLAVDRAAAAIAALPLTQWGHWAIYLLETLDARLDDNRGFRGVLDTVLDAVLTRSYMNRW